MGPEGGKEKGRGAVPRPGPAEPSRLNPSGVSYSLSELGGAFGQRALEVPGLLPTASADGALGALLHANPNEHRARDLQDLGKGGFIPNIPIEGVNHGETCSSGHPRKIQMPRPWNGLVPCDLIDPILQNEEDQIPGSGSGDGGQRSQVHQHATIAIQA